MNSAVGRPEVGQWYRQADKDELFQVVGVDEDAGTIETQTFDGDLDEIEVESWDLLPLARAEPPEDWTGPMDDIERDDLGNADVEPVEANWTQPPEPLAVEAWDDTRGGLPREPELPDDET